MHSLDRISVLVSAPLSSAGHLQGLAAIAAMLICAAVVLNVGPFANAPNGDGLRGAGHDPASGVMEQPNGSRSVPPPETAARTPRIHSQSAVTPEYVSAPIEAVTRTSLLSGIEAAPSVSQPVQQSPRGETEAKPQRRDPDSVEPMKRDMIVGVWAPDAGTCSASDFRDGVLPTVINIDGAWAGETFCMFARKEKTETGWKVLAKCSNPREHWTSNVRLTVAENRLTWTSRRGTQAYTRCEPDVLMAQAK